MPALKIHQVQRMLKVRYAPEDHQERRKEDDACRVLCTCVLDKREREASQLRKKTRSLQYTLSYALSSPDASKSGVGRRKVEGESDCKTLLPKK